MFEKFSMYKLTPSPNLSPAPLPNPLLRGEGKGITFNTGEALKTPFPCREGGRGVRFLEIIGFI
jgi:hypothetical protein